MDATIIIGLIGMGCLAAVIIVIAYKLWTADADYLPDYWEPPKL